MELAVNIEQLGKMYKLYASTHEKLIDVFHLNRLRFWKPRVDYTEFWALRNLDLQVKKGSRLGIIGKNGAGKSTLLKLITGNITPTEGSIAVTGKIQALMQLGTGFHPEFTGRENIYAALSYSGLNRSRIKLYEDEIIDFSELEDFIDQPVKYYSSGMYSRLAFAVSTILDPDILIIDEVLGAGDAAFTTKCAERMRKLTHEHQTTVLFVSHSMESVLEICEQAILIERGHITHAGDALEISKIYNKKVREEEEVYLRAKEYKMRKKDVRAMAAADPAQLIFLFRFAVSADHPTGKHRIYTCSLLADGIEAATLAVGDTMDNNVTEGSRIIDGIGFMDWDNPRKDSNGYYRSYSNQNGSNFHAPFQLALPRHLADGALSLSIKASPDKTPEDVFVDIWDGQEYRRLGVLAREPGISIFTLPVKALDSNIDTIAPVTQEAENEPQGSDSAAREATPDDRACSAEPAQESRLDVYNYQDLEQSNSIYGNQAVTIATVDLVNGSGVSKRVFQVGERLVFRVQISAKQPIDRFVFVVAVLTETGKAATQVFCSSESLGITNFCGTDLIEAAFEPLRIGSGEYMASIGLFTEYDITSEAENQAYCVVDRAVFFKIIQPDSMKKVLGAVAHNCSFSYRQGRCVYDPTLHLIQGDKEKLL